MVLLKTCDHGLVHLLPAFSLLLLLIAFRASFVYHDEQNSKNHKLLLVTKTNFLQ